MKDRPSQFGMDSNDMRFKRYEWDDGLGEWIECECDAADKELAETIAMTAFSSLFAAMGLEITRLNVEAMSPYNPLLN